MNVVKKELRRCSLNSVANVDEVDDKNNFNFDNRDDSWNFDSEDFNPSFEFVEDKIDSKYNDDNNKIKDIFSETSKIDKLITRNKEHRKNGTDSGTVSTATNSTSSGSSSSTGGSSKGYYNTQKSSSSSRNTRRGKTYQQSCEEEEEEEHSESSYVIPASEIDSRHRRSSIRKTTTKTKENHHEEIEDDPSVSVRKNATGHIHPCLNAYSLPRNSSSMLGNTKSLFGDSFDFSEHGASEASDASDEQSSVFSEYSGDSAASESSSSLFSSSRRLRSNGNDKTVGRKRNSTKCRKARRRPQNHIRSTTDNASSARSSNDVSKPPRRNSTDSTKPSRKNSKDSTKPHRRNSTDCSPGAEGTKEVVSSSRKSTRRNSNDSYLSTAASSRPDKQRAPTSAVSSPIALNRKHRSLRSNMTGRSQQKRATRKTRSTCNGNPNKNDEEISIVTNDDTTKDQDTDGSNISRCRAKRSEIRFKRNLLSSHNSLRSMDGPSESNKEETDDERTGYLSAFNKTNGLSSLYGMNGCHGSSIAKQETTDDDESESNSCHLDDILQSVKSKHSSSIGNGTDFFTGNRKSINSNKSNSRKNTDKDGNNRYNNDDLEKLKNKLIFQKRSKSKLRKKEKKSKKEERKNKKNDKRVSVEELEEDSTEFSNSMLFDETDESSNSEFFSFVGGNYSNRIIAGDVVPNINDTDTNTKRSVSIKSFRKIARNDEKCN